MLEKPMKQPKNFRLSNYAVEVLNELAKSMKINRTAVVELAIARFSKDQQIRKQEHSWG